MRHFNDHKSNAYSYDHDQVEHEKAESSFEESSRLDQIRARIDKGYYFSDRVDEDISDKLGKILDDYEF